MPHNDSVIPIQVSAAISTSFSRRSRELLPLLMTFLSTHHSPTTVNKNAVEFVMGTVRLSSERISGVARGGYEEGLTGLPDQQEEPDTPGQVDDQGNGVARVPQQVNDTEEGRVQAAAEPAGLDGGRIEDRV